MRNSVVVILDTERNGVHFCESKLKGEDVWFPVDLRNDLFRQIETIMVMNGVAVNVSSVRELRRCGKSIEFTVIYNVVETDSKQCFFGMEKKQKDVIKEIIYNLGKFTGSGDRFKNTTEFIKQNVDLFEYDPIAACGNLCALGGWVCINGEQSAHFNGSEEVYDLCSLLRHELRMMRGINCAFPEKALAHYVEANKTLTEICSR